MPTQYETITEKDLLLKDAKTQLDIIMNNHWATTGDGSERFLV